MLDHSQSCRWCRGGVGDTCHSDRRKAKRAGDCTNADDFFRVMAIPFLLLFTRAVQDALWVDKEHLTWRLSKPCAAAHKCFCRFERAGSQRWSVNADVS
jgi:hypothetical protein